MTADNAITMTAVTVEKRRHGWSKPVRLLDGIDLQIPNGSVCALLGNNGAGKTTCIKTIVGLVQPCQGTVQLWQQPACLPTARQRLGYMPEQPYVPLQLTAWEWLYHHAQLTGMSAKQARQRVAALLADFALTAVQHQRLSSCSKGMLQRVGLCQAMVHAPDLLVLDEPMSGLDQPGQQLMRELITRWYSLGKTVLFSSHSQQDVALICDKTIVLHAGRVDHDVCTDR